MAYEFKFPDVGEGVTEGEIVKWHVKEGDKVKEDQVLAEVETDKAIVEIPSPKTATILKLHAKAGERIEVGDTLVTFGDSGEKVSEAKEEEPEEKSSHEKEDKPAKKETSEEKTQAPKKAPSAMVKTQHAEQAPSGRVIATPAVRRLAREMKVDISTIKGTGPAGRVTKDDLQKGGTKVEKPAEDKSERGAAKKLPALKVDHSKYGEVEEIPFKGIRKRISENMVRSLQNTAPVTHHDTADVTELAKLRKKEKARAEKKGIKLTFLPFVIKAVLAALKKFPHLNASLDEEKGVIIVKKYYNMGIAVQTDKGLMVPVIKDIDEKSMYDIAKEIQTLADKTRKGKVEVENLKGSTFTITNVGSIGGWFFTPIIYYPEVAILGLGRMKDQAVILNGKAEIRKVMPISLTFDHRVVDGAIAAQFANEIIQHLEDPDLLLMDVV